MAHINRNWSDFIPKVPGWITGLISFVTAVVGFIKLWQGDAGLVTIVLLAVGAGGGTLGCAYLAFKRTPPLVLDGRGTWQYPHWRRWALASLVIIPLLTASGVGYYRYQQTRPPTTVILLVANFDGPEPQKYGVTETVLNRLRQALEPYDDVQVEALGWAITEAEGSAAARAEGEKCKAAVVIWGWYRTPGEVVPLSVYFEVLRPPKYMPALGPEVKGQVQTMAVADLKGFTLQTQLSAEMAYLSIFTVGMVRYTTEDWDGAIARFSNALSQTAERVPLLDQSVVYFKRGVAYHYKGDLDRAIADYSQAIQLQPDYAEAYNNRGAAYTGKGDLDRAIADYGQAIQLRPELVEAHYNRGVAYADKGDLDHAIADYSQAIQLQPDYAEAYNNRGIAHCDAGNLEQAIRDYDKAIELDPALVRTYNNRGIVHADAGNLEQAIRDYDKAIELDPDYANAYNDRAFAYYSAGNLEQAIRDYDKAVELNPAFAEAYYNRGIAHADAGNLEQAIRDYDKAIELNPAFADCYFNRGIAHADAGNLEQAIRDFEQYLRLAPNAPDGEIVMNAIEQLKSELSP